MPQNLPMQDTAEEPDIYAPLGGTRAQAVHRLQVGVLGLMAMLLLVGLANIIMDRAQETEALAVPEAASTIAPGNTPAPKKDPLADAGVVPDLPAEPAVAAEPHTTGGQGNGDGAPQRP